MRLANVHGQKIRVIFIVVEDLDDVADLATERRSSEAAKHDNQGFCSGTFKNVKRFRAVEREDARVGRSIPDFQVAAVHMRQSVARHVDGVFRTPCHHRKHNEGNDEERAKTYSNRHEDLFHSENPLTQKLGQENNSEA
jgi:hypothetical protein